MDTNLAARIRSNPTYARLRSQRNRYAWTLTIVMLVIYYGFILVDAFFPAVLAQTISGSITLGFLLGIAVILAAILLTGLYVLRANGTYDQMTQQIRREVGQ